MLKKHMVPFGKKTQKVSNKGKGAVEETLPSRHALSTLTSGSPLDRTMNNYAKATPMANPQFDSPDIQGGGDYGS